MQPVGNQTGPNRSGESTFVHTSMHQYVCTSIGVTCWLKVVNLMVTAPPARCSNCVTGAGCWSKPTPPTPTVPSCPLTTLKVCIAARSGRGHGLIPLGSICAPRCPAGFMNTSIFCPAIPSDVTETALDCLYHQNPLKPTDKGYNKSCGCPGNVAPDGSPTCTCLSACALTGCPTDAACGAGRVCNKRSQFHVCLFPWDTAACGPAGVKAEQANMAASSEPEISATDWQQRVESTMHIALRFLAISCCGDSTQPCVVVL
jgi:hypothetical protein